MMQFRWQQLCTTEPATVE